MKALIRKEAVELAIPTALLLAAVTFLWLMGAETRRVLVQPSQIAGLAVFTVSGLGGCFFALFQFYGERVKRTEGYLAHRGTSATRVFTAKMFVGLAAAFASAVVPPLVFAIAAHFESPFAPIIRYERVGEFVWIATFVAPAYAVGALTAQLRRGILGELMIGGIAALALALVALLSSATTEGSLSALRYVAAQLGIAAGLLVLAERLFRRSLDPDLPLPGSPYRAIFLLGAVTFVWPVLTFDGIASSLLADALRDAYPTLVRERATGRFFAVTLVPPNDYVEVDSHGEIVAGAPRPPHLFTPWGSNATYDVLFSPTYHGIRTREESLRRHGETRWQLLNGDWQNLGSRSIAPDDRDVVVAGYIDPADGVLRFVFEPARHVTYFHDGSSVERPVVPFSQHLPFETEIRRPDGAPFSPSTRAAAELRHGAEPGTTFLVFDPADGTFWRADPRDATNPIAPALLPNGDRFVRLERSEGGEAVADFGGRRVAVGERGLYAWDGAEFVAYERAGPASSSEPDYRFVMTDRDAIAPRVEVRSKEDDSLLRVQEYGPRGSIQWSLAVAAYALALAKAPLASVTSFLTPTDDAIGLGLDVNPAIVEPLFFGGDRPVLLVVSLLLAGFAVRAVVLRLRARETDAWTTWIWAILVAALGLPSLWWFLLLEPRASKSSERAASEEPRTSMLICDESSPAPSGAQGLA